MILLFKGRRYIQLYPVFFYPKKNGFLVTLKEAFSELRGAILNSRKLRISTFLDFLVQKTIGGHAATGQQLFTSQNHQQSLYFTVIIALQLL